MEDGELFLNPEDYADYDELEEGQITAYPDELDNQRQLEMLSEQLFRSNCKEITLENILGVNLGLHIDSAEFVRTLLGNIYTGSPVLRLSKLYPEYNYATINITILDGIIVNRMQSPAYFRMIKKTNSQYMFIDIVIKYKYINNQEINYHANSVFVDKLNLIAEYFEPQCNPEFNMDIQLQVSRILRKYVHNHIRMTITSQSCPNLGPQSIANDNFCQTWSTMFLYYKINHPEISINEIYEFFSRMNRDQLNLYMKAFNKCFIWIITDMIDLMITATRIIGNNLTDSYLYLQKCNPKDIREMFEDTDLIKYDKYFGLIYPKYEFMVWYLSHTRHDSESCQYTYNLAVEILNLISVISKEFNSIKFYMYLDRARERKIIRDKMISSKLEVKLNQ